MNSFSEAHLVQELEAIPPRLRVVFAACCAERLRPAYLAFAIAIDVGRAQEFVGLLDQLWIDLCGAEMSADEVATNIDRCMNIIPRPGERPWSALEAYAEDAGAALAYAFRCRAKFESREAAWAARRVYEAIDQYLIVRDRLDVNSRAIEDRLLADPLIQTELARQQRDISELRSGGLVTQVAAVARSRAKIEAGTVLGAFQQS